VIAPSAQVIVYTSHFFEPNSRPRLPPEQTDRHAATRARKPIESNGRGARCGPEHYGIRDMQPSRARPQVGDFGVPIPLAREQPNSVNGDRRFAAVETYGHAIEQTIGWRPIICRLRRVAVSGISAIIGDVAEWLKAAVC
jgi:hypothetical protein